MDTNDNDDDDDDDNNNDNDYDIADEDTRMRLRLDAGRLEDELQEAKEDLDFYKHKYLQLVRERVTREVEDIPRSKTAGVRQRSRMDVGMKRRSEAIADLASSSIQSRKGKEQKGIGCGKLGGSPNQSDRNEHIKMDTGDEVNGHGSVIGTRPGAAGGKDIDDHANGARGDLGADESQGPSMSRIPPSDGRKGSTSISLIHPHPLSSSPALSTSPRAGIGPSKVQGNGPLSHSSLRFNVSSRVRSPSIPLDDLPSPAHTSITVELPVPDQRQQSNLVLKDSSDILPGSMTDDPKPDGFSLGSKAAPYMVTPPSISLPVGSTSSSHAQPHPLYSSSSNISTLGFLDNSYLSAHVPKQSRPSNTMINHGAGRPFDVPQSTNLAITHAETTTGETAIISVNGDSENSPSSSFRSRLGNMASVYTTSNTIPVMSHASESHGSVPNLRPIPDNQAPNCDPVLATSARSSQNRIGGPQDGNEVPYQCTGLSLSIPSGLTSSSENQDSTDSYIRAHLAHNSMIQLPSLPSMNPSASPLSTLKLAHDPHRPGSAIDAPVPNCVPPLATRPERPGWISAQNRLQASRPPLPGTSSKPDIVLRGIFNPKRKVGVPNATTEFGSTSSSKLASTTALHPFSDTASTPKWGADTSRIGSTSSTQAISFLPSATDDLDRATPITAGVISNNTAIDHTTAPMSTFGVRFDDPLAARAINKRTFNIFAITHSSSELESSLEPNSNKDIPSLPIPYTPRFNIFAPKADPPLKHPLPPFRDMSIVPSLAPNSEVNLDLLDYTRTTISSPGTDWTGSSTTSSPYHRSSESDPRHLQPDPVQPFPPSYPPETVDQTNFSSDDEDEDTCTMVTRPLGLVQQSSTESESDSESDSGFGSGSDWTSASMKRLSAYFKSDEFLGRLDRKRHIRTQDRNDLIGNDGPSISLTPETAVRPAVPRESGISTLLGRLNRSADEMGRMVAMDEETEVVTGEERDKRKGKGKANLELAYQNAGANRDHRLFKHQSTEGISAVGQIGPDDPVFDYDINETQETRSSDPPLHPSSSTPPGSPLESYHPLTSTIVSETTSTSRSPLSSFVVDIGSQEIATAQPTSVSPNLPVTPAYDPSSLFAVHHPEESQMRKSRKRRLEALAQDEYQYPVEETGKFFFDPHYYDSPVPIQRSPLPTPPIRSYRQLVPDGRHQSSSPPPSPRPKREFRMYNRNSVSGELKDPGWMTDYDDHVKDGDGDEVEALPQTHLVPLPSMNLEGGRAAPGRDQTRDDELDEWLDQSQSGSLSLPSLPSLSPSLSLAGSTTATRGNPGSSSASGINGTTIPTNSRAEANLQESFTSSLSSLLPTSPETRLSASSIESPSVIKTHFNSGHASLGPRSHLEIPTPSSTSIISNRSGSSRRSRFDIQGLEVGLDKNSESATSRSHSHDSSKETLSIIESIIEEASHYGVDRASPGRLPSVPVPGFRAAPTSAPAPIITSRPTLPVPSSRSKLTRGHDRPPSDTGLDPNNSRNDQFISDSSFSSESDFKSKSKSQSNLDPDSHSRFRPSHSMPSIMTRSRSNPTSGTSLIVSTGSATSGNGSSKQQESVVRHSQAGGDIQRDGDQVSLLIQGQGQGLQDPKKDRLPGALIGKGKGKAAVGAKERKEDRKGKKEVDYDEAVAQMLRFCPRDRLVDWANKMSDDLNSDS